MHTVIPSSYITIDAETVSVNGSSATGHCSSVSRNGATSTCTNPISSVLLDGVIPTLTGLDGNIWASQLLTLQRTSTRGTVLFDFIDTAGYVGLFGRLEVMMFNCPEKGISASTIRVSTSSPAGSTTRLMVVVIANTSCDSLVRVCTPIATTQPSITLEFFSSRASHMVYLAEVTFYADTSASTCPPDTVVTTDGTTTTTPNTTTPNTPPPNTTAPNTTTAIESSITSVIAPVVVVICVVFMIVGIMAAVFIRWKYKTSHRTALGEGHSTHSHPPPVPPHQYQVGKKSVKKDTLPPLDKERSGVHSSEADQLYAQVDENRKEEVSIYTSPLTSKVNTPAGIVHAQVNKGKKKGEVATHSICKKLTQK